MKKSVLFLVGPTAVGKTKAAVFLAQRLNAEIVSCDSMQVYKGMDVITSKPPLSLRKKIVHHLISTISPTKEYNVSRYRREALKKTHEILKRGRIPLFVGGTGLYMSILVDGIFKWSAKDNKIREDLYREAGDKGNQYLYCKLKEVDPAAALKIHPNDTRRIVRALEVFQSTGKPISLLQKQRKGLGEKFDVRLFCLSMERGVLYKRIDERVEKMFDEGIILEVKRLLKVTLSKTARYAIGINEIKGYIAGNYSLEAAKEMVKRNTRAYAKRQLTWFRKDTRIEWVMVCEKERPKQVALRIWKKLS